MSSATTATTTAMTSASASTRTPIVGANTATATHCHTVCVQACPVGGAAMNQAATTMATMAASATAATATVAMARLGMRKPASASTRKPANGSAGMSHSQSRISAPHARRHVGVERAPLPVQPQHQRQSHGDFGGRHGQDEQEHHLAVGLVPARTGDHERQPRRVQHDLDRHEDEDHVAASQHADDAEHEQESGEGERDVGRYHHASPFSAARARCSAPTRPASSKSDASSAPMKYAPKSDWPTCLGATSAAAVSARSVVARV